MRPRPGNWCQLLADPRRLLLHQVAFGDHDPCTVGGREEFEDRQALVLVVKPLANGNDSDAVDGGGRPLRRRIEPSERLDHITDEFQPHRFGIARREDVDDATADGERTVFVDRIGSSEPGVDQQVGKGLRIDLRT